MADRDSIPMSDHLDERSFELLFRKFFPVLMRFARKFLPDEDDAREVIHQVFINLWEKRDEVDTSTPFKSYLFTSVHNRCLNRIRDKKKFADEEMPDLAGETNVETHMEAMELESKIRQVIGTLPEKCREIFELNRFEGLKYAEIAEKLGISVKTVENQMSKALKILREKLAEYLALLLWLVLTHLN